MERARTTILVLSVIELLLITSWQILASSLAVSYSSRYTMLNPSIILAVGAMLLGAFVIWLALFIYVPRHAKRNGHSMPLWGFLCFFFGGAATLIYAAAIKPNTAKASKGNQQA